MFEIEDEFSIASAARCSDYTSAIENLRCENWAFNRITLNPQMLRYKMYPALDINPTEKDHLRVGHVRPLFNVAKYDTRHNRGNFNFAMLPTEVMWGIREVNLFTTHALMWPKRDTTGLEHKKEFVDLVVNRDLTEFHDLSIGPHYDISAETMSPYIPPQGLGYQPTIVMGQLSHAILKASMHIHAPFRSPGLHNPAITRRTFIEGLNGLLNAPVYGFDNEMFIIQPIDLHDNCKLPETTKAAQALKSFGLWTPTDKPTNQLIGLTIGNLRGSYVPGTLPEIVVGQRGRGAPELPEAFELFLLNNTFFVWNRERMAEYLDKYLGYKMSNNFISI
ncbi:MAG: hypothetical protein GY738_29350, partial [Pseudoalteromonas sp.]|nr:hypothetical protein [Pseudoalteromonas sp.]